MTVPDLVFIPSFLFCAFLLLRLAFLAIRGRWTKCRGTALTLILFVAAYAVALVGLALLTPRRELAPGQRKCYDDWCIAASGVEQQPTAALCPGAATVWVATLDVASVARRVQQRAPDTTVELEDATGKRYPPCQLAGLKTIRDLIGPGQSISASLPFALPAGARPVGFVVHHGAFPGLIIAGDDQSWLHDPTLLRIAVR